jgi:NAD(P)-dependent dehydrogenase (short-subunit alcohol dehydrogenase family)
MTASGRGRLAGRTAFITGAASGIGAAAARLFATEGATVVACDIADASAVAGDIANAGGRCGVVRCDVSDPEAVRTSAEAVFTEYGTVDVLFSNAGTLAGDGPAHSLDPVEADRILAVNLQGLLHTCRYFIPAMVDAGGGSIVATASVGGMVGALSNHAYCASKGGVIAFVRAVAVTYGRSGIRANVICPGPTRSGMSAQLGGADWERDRAAAVPLGRIALPDEIAAAALFLASGEASYVTGAVLPVDGGRTAA